MSGASSTRSTWCTLRPLRPKRWPGSAPSLPSKMRSAASPPILGRASASQEPGRCSTNCEPGWRGHCAACLPRAKPRARSVTRFGAGVPSRAKAKMACSRSTTAQLNGRCEPSLSDARTTSSSDRTAAVNVPRFKRMGRLINFYYLF